MIGQPDCFPETEPDPAPPSSVEIDQVCQDYRLGSATQGLGVVARKVLYPPVP